MTEPKELNWYFVEFLKALIALSLPVKEQIKAYGEGPIGKEMYADFKGNYTDFKDEFFTNGQILEVHKIEIDKLELFLNSKKDDFFNELQSLIDDQQWEEVRLLAKNCIKLMEMEHLGLETTIVEEPSVDENGEEVIFQIIQTQIINKS